MSAVRVVHWRSHVWSTKMVVPWAYSEVEQRVESWCRSAWEVWSTLCSISVSFYPTSFCPLLGQPACVSSLKPSSVFQLLPTCHYLLHSSSIHSVNRHLLSPLELFSPMQRWAPLTSCSHSSGSWHQPADKPNRAPREVSTQHSNNSCSLFRENRQFFPRYI